MALFIVSVIFTHTPFRSGRVGLTPLTFIEIAVCAYRPPACNSQEGVDKELKSNLEWPKRY